MSLVTVNVNVIVVNGQAVDADISGLPLLLQGPLDALRFLHDGRDRQRERERATLAEGERR